MKLEEIEEQITTQPDNPELWDQAEQSAIDDHQHERMAALYATALQQSIAPAVADEIGQRAVGWYEEWLGETAPGLADVLERVIQLDPENPWAFQKLTVIHTAEGRWEELLASYDRMIDAAGSEARRRELLDEAHAVARDLAHDAKATSRYLSQLLALDPKDETLAAALERLLLKNDDHLGLVEHLRGRLTHQSKADGHATRLRIAGMLYEPLRDANAAVDELETLFGDGVQPEGSLSLLESVAADEQIQEASRRRAYALLEERYRLAGRSEDLVRTLNAALTLGGQADPRLHRAAGEKLLEAGDSAGAFGHFSSVLVALPADRSARETLRRLANETRDFSQYVDVLERAAEAAEELNDQHVTQVSLLEEAARIAHERSQDQTRRRSLLDSAFSVAEEQGQRLSVARDLLETLGGLGEDAEEASIAQWLAEHGETASERRRARVRSADLFGKLERYDEAIALWSSQLQSEPGDAESQRGLISVLTRAERYAELASYLRTRAQGDESAQGHADLQRAAGLLSEEVGDAEASLAVWEEIERRFGASDHSVRQRVSLLERLERWEEAARCLEGEVDRQSSALSRALIHAGVLERDQLDRGPVAARMLARALAFEPTNASARAGLLSLADNEEAADVALAGLARAYRDAGEREAVLNLLEPRLARAQSAQERTDLYREAYALRSDTGDHVAAAQDLIEAVRNSPDDEALSIQMLARARDAGLSEQAYDLLTELCEVVDDEARRQGMHRMAFDLAVRDLRRPDAILHHGQVVFASEPSSLSVSQELLRASSGEAQWERFARVFAQHLGTQPVLSEHFVSLIEGWIQLDSGPRVEALDAMVAALVDQELAAAVARDLALTMGRWWIAAGNLEQADACYVRALEVDARSQQAIDKLVELRRPNGGLPAFEALNAAFALDESNLDAGYEAAQVALRLEDPTRSAESLQRVLDAASALVRQRQSARGERTAEDVCTWAIDTFASLCVGEGDSDRALRILESGSTLPMPERQRWMREAADLALRLGQRDRATELYRGVLSIAEDQEAMAALAALCEEDGRFVEMLGLRRRALAAASDLDERVRLRLEVARVVSEIEKRGGRIDALRDNLREVPGHRESIEELSRVLEAHGQWDALVDELRIQARHIAQQGDITFAAELWNKVAQVQEHHRADTEAACDAYRNAVELVPSPASLESLANLRAEQGEHAVAAQWLERRLSSAAEDERAEVTYKLAQSYIHAGHRERAVLHLERGSELYPADENLRNLLVELYQEDGNRLGLAEVWARSAVFLKKRDAMVARAREAAETFSDMGIPERAVTVLEQAREAAPDDQRIQLLYADALRGAEQHEQAAEVLHSLAESFGRRRTPERADVHARLGRVYREAGRLDEAIEELAKASSIDMKNPVYQMELGEVAVQHGSFDKAERAYRSLLLHVRRMDDPAKELGFGLADVQFVMSKLATAQGDETQASELWRSAVERAQQRPDETATLIRRLIEEEDFQRALQVAEARLVEANGETQTVELRGDVLRAMGDTKAALQAYCEAVVTSDMDGAALFDKTRALASEAGEGERYLKSLESKFGKGGLTKVHKSELLTRMALVQEEDLGRLEGATNTLRQIEELGVDPVAALQGQARIAARQGDTVTQGVLLETIARGGSEIPVSHRTQALLTLAELKFGDEAERAEGTELIQEALRLEPRYTDAAKILRNVEISMHPPAMEVYAQVVRSSTDSDLLLDFQAKKARMRSATVEDVREAYGLAQRQGNAEIAREMLHRAIEVADEQDDVTQSLWAAEALSDGLLEEGKPQEAFEILRKVADAAGGDEGVRLWRKAAERAQDAGEIETAREVYQSLFSAHATHEEVWPSYLNFLSRTDDEEGLAAARQSLKDEFFDGERRDQIDLMWAKYLLGKEGRESDAATVLRDVLGNQPDHPEASSMLADVFERTGFSEDLVELLREQYSKAVAVEDSERIAEVGLRLGETLARVDEEAALEVYRDASEKVPRDRALAEALLNAFDEDVEERERVIAEGRLLATDEPDVVGARALNLAVKWEELGEQEHVVQVLEAAYDRNPEQAKVREALEEAYHGASRWSQLASFLGREAARLEDPLEQAALLRRAATIRWQHLEQADAAAELLSRAIELSPEDPAGVEDAARMWFAAGKPNEVISAVERSRPHVADSERWRLELVRAQALQFDSRLDESVTAYRAAFNDAPTEVFESYQSALEALRDDAVSQGEAERERTAIHEMVAVGRRLGQPNHAYEPLAGWYERNEQDRESLDLLIELDRELGDGQALINHSGLRVQMTEGEAQIDAALALAQAAEEAQLAGQVVPVLETVAEQHPHDQTMRERLRSLYASAGAYAKLAGLLMIDVEDAQNEDQRHELLKQAGRFYVLAGDPQTGLVPLQQAFELRPDDHETVVALVDGYIESNQIAEAGQTLETAIAAHTRKRGPQLAELQHRMARLAALAGDPDLQIQWLVVAMESDKSNLDIASELAELAIAQEDHDTALSALRTITLSKKDGPISRGRAFLMQAQVAHTKGENRRAILWARKARSEEPDLAEAEAFLEQLNG